MTQNEERARKIAEKLVGNHAIYSIGDALEAGVELVTIALTETEKQTARRIADAIAEATVDSTCNVKMLGLKIPQCLTSNNMSGSIKELFQVMAKAIKKEFGL